MADDLVSLFGTGRNGHSHFAPSAAAMWLHCAGSLLANVAAGDNAGFDAAYGTVAHGVAEAWNKTGRRPTYMIGTHGEADAGGTRYRIKIDEEMVNHVGRFVEWCAELPGDHYTERRVDLSALMPIPDQGGTADHFACEVGRLTITDLKMGTGVRVYAHRNPQAMLYAAGVFLEWDWIYRFEHIVIRICQPRLDVFEIYECTRQELLDFMAFVKERAAAAWAANAPRTPSAKACRWCAVNASCPARAHELADFVDAAFAGECEEEARTYPQEALREPQKALKRALATSLRVEDVMPQGLPTEALALILLRRRHFEKWFKAVAQTLLDRAERGEDIRWHKLVDGRKKRTWKDATVAQEFIDRVFGVSPDEVCPPTMLTVNAAEKLIHARTKQAAAKVKTTLRDVVDEFAGKRTLVPDTDNRPDIADIIGEFEVEEEEGEEENGSDAA